MEILRKYATATHLYLPIIKRGVVDFAVGADWTPVAGDVKISIDGGAAANVTNLPTAIAMGNTAYWDFSMTSGELTGKKIVITVADAATKAVEDQSILVVTYGSTSGEYAVDLTDGVRAGLTALPNAAAEAAGGLYTRGTGAGQIRQDANGRIDTNTKALLDGTIPAPNVTGVPLVDLKYTLGTISPATAGSVRADAVTGAVGSVTGAVGSVTAGVTVSTNNDKTGYGLSAAAVQAVWDALTSALTTVGSIGKRVADFITGDAFARLGAPAGASVSADIAAVQADTTNIKTRIPAALVSGRIDASVGSYPGNTAQTGDNFARLGAPAGASVSADVAAIQADTDNLQTRVPAALVSGRMDASVGAMATDVVTATAIQAGAITSSEAPALANLDAAVSTRATPAQVLTQVEAGLATDTYSQPGQGNPPATTSLAVMIAFLYKAFRNRFTQTATTAKLYADDASTVDQKATVSDDGTTFDRGELATGP